MKLQTLDDDCSVKINERLNDEYYAHYFYKSAANYCKTVGYDGGYKYFTEEAEHELQHVKRIEEYLCNWNILPTLKQVNRPPVFTSLPEIISKAYELEYNLLDSYNTDILSVLDESSYTFTFLQEFVKIQTDSVFEYSTLINKLELIGNDKFALFYFDKEVLGAD